MNVFNGKLQTVTELGLLEHGHLEMENSVGNKGILTEPSLTSDKPLLNSDSVKQVIHF